jgi:hypothetical protein
MIARCPRYIAGPLIAMGLPAAMWVVAAITFGSGAVVADGRSVRLFNEVN